MHPIRLEVASERGPYGVLIGPGVAGQTDVLTRAPGGGTRVVVSSAPIWRLHGARLRPIARGRPPALIPDGERAKSLATVGRLYDAFVRRAVDRSSVVIALGGGVLGDVAGYAAATFLRGLAFVQVPTTLVAQVDSAIGGKVGVNLPAGKNLVGAFHPPRLVICDPRLLHTLPRREFRAGLYEVIKYGVIASRPLFDRVSADLEALFDQDLTLLTRVIGDCCAIKASVVAADEREAGPRRVLNFGHTVGHALEAATGYRRFRHGEAVGYGMLAAADISTARGLLSRDDEAQLADVIRRVGPLPPVADVRMGDVLDATGRDKKVVRGRLHFVLAAGIGGTTIVTDVSTTELRAALRRVGLRR
jgi:3-dehydroquinate synthase